MSDSEWAWYGVLLGSAGLTLLGSIIYSFMFMTGRKPSQSKDAPDWSSTILIPAVGYCRMLTLFGLLFNVLSFVYVFLFTAEDSSASWFNIKAMTARPVQQTFSLLIYGSLLLQYSTVQGAINKYLQTEQMWQKKTPMLIQIMYLLVIVFGYLYSLLYKERSTVMAMSYIQDSVLLTIATMSGLLSYTHLMKIRGSKDPDEYGTRMFTMMNILVQTAIAGLSITHIIGLAEDYELPPDYRSNIVLKSSMEGTIATEERLFSAYGNIKVLRESFRVFMFAWFSLYIMVVCPQPQKEQQSGESSLSEMVARYSEDDQEAGKGTCDKLMGCFKMSMTKDEDNTSTTEPPAAKTVSRYIQT